MRDARPRKDHRGVDLISDVLPFGRLWYGEPNGISNAIGYAKFPSGSHIPFSIRDPSSTGALLTAECASAEKALIAIVIP